MTPTLSDTRLYPAQITDRLIRGASVPTGERVELPSDVRYSAVAVDTTDQISVTFVAAVRQPTVRVFTSERGDPCWIRVRRGETPKLIVLDQIRHVNACDP